MATSSSSCCASNSANSASCSWREIIDSCNQICQRNQEVLDRRPSLKIVYCSKWRCLTRCYSLVLQSLVSRLLEHLLNKGILCTQKLIVALEALYQTMLEGEVCLRECTVESFSHSWLVEKALKLWTSTDVVDLHLHDFIWAYATVLEQAINANISHMDSDDVVQEVCKLSEIWADEDVEEDFSVAQELLNKVKCEQEGETSVLADFILQKLAFMENSRSDAATDVVPPFLWVDQGSLQTNRTEFLGQGSYGIVYVASWLGGRFAVKDIFYSEQCQAEPAIQARLCHPNVINLVCCSKKSYRQQGCSMVMELMHKDLQHLMQERLKGEGINNGRTGPFSLLEAVDLMLQVAKGMEYLHSLNIMHRDLKSSNVLVSLIPSSAAVHIKITDFGMAKAKETSSYFSTKPTGTLFWRAPEIFDDISKDRYRKTADVYSFGLLCYEVLTGKLPFEETKELKRRVIGGERPQLPSYCPSALASYIERCWDGNASRRPSFTLTCLMLRYFKACILLDNHGPNAAHSYNWLQYPLSSRACDSINDMLQAKELTRRVRPRPLTILLEMYCCRVVLQESKDCLALATSTPSITYSPSSEQSSRQIINGSSPSIEQVNGFSTESRWNTKRFARRFVNKIKKAFRIDKSDFAYQIRDVLDSGGGTFTYKDLALATANFSKRIGQGGFSSVYHGVQRNGREIAVKVFQYSHTQRRWALLHGTVLQELKIARQLRHRHIVPLLGWCVQDEEKLQVLLVYEFMHNGDLQRHLHGDWADQHVFVWKQRYKAVTQLASALRYLHHDSGNVQIVHRDVKPANVLLDSEWNARLTDCGLAVLLRNDILTAGVDLTTAGTLGFLAPEILKNLHGDVSPAVDLYAFGMTVLIIASGRKVFNSDLAITLREWIWDLYQRGELMNAADIRLQGAYKYDDVEMQRLLLLGLSCSNPNPYTRPTIEQVLSILSGESEPPPPENSTYSTFSEMAANYEITYSSGSFG